jgi:hypothetical protein
MQLRGNYPYQYCARTGISTYFNRATNSFETLKIDGQPVIFEDSELIDTPMLPNIFWLSWALSRAKTFATEFQATVEVDSNYDYYRFFFRKNSKSLEISISDFILRFANVGGANAFRSELAAAFDN